MPQLASKIVSGFFGAEGDKKEIRNSLIKRKLGLADEGIPIGRETAPPGFIKWTIGVNDVCNEGATVASDGGKAVP